MKTTTEKKAPTTQELVSPEMSKVMREMGLPTEYIPVTASPHSRLTEIMQLVCPHCKTITPQAGDLDLSSDSMTHEKYDPLRCFKCGELFALRLARIEFVTSKLGPEEERLSLARDPDL
ncbi:hypothetical protein J4419_05015 [Candidatus Woesearchaeota archaeon]|nr:hypothetical protein [Candidatus Woesearchaeota archaeon]